MIGSSTIPNKLNLLLADAALKSQLTVLIIKFSTIDDAAVCAIICDPCCPTVLPSNTNFDIVLLCFIPTHRAKQPTESMLL